MFIETLVVGPLQANCYIVGDEATSEALVIDPGGDADKILDVVAKLGATVKMIVNTHGHVDHILANGRIKEATNAPIAIHAADAGMLTNPLAAFSFLLGVLKPSPPANVMLYEGDVLDAGDVHLHVIHTPGHSRGGICLYEEKEGVVFTGDTLFQGGIGRTDFPGGSHQTLLDSIRTKLLTLPDETVVYPGHGPATTIGQERRYNPFLV